MQLKKSYMYYKSAIKPEVCKKIISNRTFTIKNAIDWKKFTSGVI